MDFCSTKNSVYAPAEDSLLFEEVVNSAAGPQKGDRVLDMGTGSGILAIAAAKKGCDVTAADINPEALEFAKREAKESGVKIRFVQSDLFSNIRGKFDVIMFNPPYVQTDSSEAADLQSIAWHGGKKGCEVIDRFLSTAFKFLKPRGRILLLVSSQNRVTTKLRSAYGARILAEKRLFFESLYMVELTGSECRLQSAQ